MLYQTTGRYADAEPLYKRALEIDEKVYGKEHPSVATRLVNLADLYRTTGRYAEGEPLFTRALKILEKVHGEEHPSVAACLNNLALLYETTGRYAEAEPLFTRALSIAPHTGDPDLLRTVQANYSSLLQRQGNPDAAIFFGKQAVNTIQGMRENITRMGKETIKAFTAKIEDVYKDVAGLLIQEDRLEEAQQVLDFLKEEKYFRFIGQRVRESSLTLTPTETRAKKRLQDVSGPLSAARREYETLKKINPRTAEEEDRIAVLEKQPDTARNAYMSALNEIVGDLLGKKERVGTPEATNLSKTLAQLGSTAAIYAVSGRERLFLLVVTAQSRKVFTVPITEEDLYAKVFAFRRVLRDPRLDPLPLSQELYRIIVKPVESKGFETLMWYLDGALLYIPVAALHDGDRYMVERFRNVVYSASSLDALERTPSSSWKGIFAGVTEPHGGFPALRNVRGELTGIMKPAGPIAGELLIDKTFTWPAMQKALTKGYPLVHIASHFSAMPGNDTQSSSSGTDNASACET